MNPTHQALTQILGGSLKDVEILDYSISEDFEKLWKFEGLANRILIVWGRTAPDAKLWPIDASACLSPPDWAAAYARHHFPEKAKHPKDAQWPQIMILDADPAAHASVPTLAHFHTLREDQLPWLTVPKIPSLNDVRKWLALDAESLSETKQDALTRFLRDIRLNLTEVRTKGDYDRHAISNIVAPMALLGKTANPSLYANALLKLLEACGLSGNQESVDQSTQPNVINDLSILLVDDQAEHGWAQWLEASLNPKKLAYRTDPNSLLDALEEQLKRADEEAETDNPGTRAKDRRFRFGLPGIKNRVKPILFLDIRLFSGRQDAETGFFIRLLDLIDERFKVNTDLAWPGFYTKNESTAFVKASKALRDGKKLALESPDHHEALTWLPRVIALADMSLPIVIFSSTDRATIRKSFDPYGNIITSFGKPRAAQFTAQFASTARQDLLSSLEVASTILRCREKCRKLWRIAKMAKDSRTQYSFQPTDGLSSHIELYLDEKTDGGFWVGGLFAIFDSSQDARDFEDCCVKKGVHYFNRKGLLPQPTGPLLKKGTQCGIQLGQAVAEWKKNGRRISLGFVRLKDRDNLYGEADQDLELTDKKLADNRFRFLLESLIELFLTETCNVAVVKDTRLTCSIFCGTRLLSTRNTQSSHSLAYRFGLRMTPFDHTLSYSVGQDSLQPIAASVFRSHPQLCSENRIKIERCIALTFPYRNEAFSNCIDSNGNIVSIKRDSTEDDLKHTLKKHKFWITVEGAGIAIAANRWQEWGSRLVESKDLNLTPNTLYLENGLQFTQIPTREIEKEVVDDWRPDAPVLFYVADCLLHPNSLDCYRTSILPTVFGQFDDVLDGGLLNCITAGRALDCGDVIEALVKYSFDKVPVGTYRHVSNARMFIGARIGRALEHVDGACFRLAAGLMRSPEDSFSNHTAAMECGGIESHPVKKVFEVTSRPQSSRKAITIIDLPEYVMLSDLIESLRLIGVSVNDEDVTITYWTSSGRSTAKISIGDRDIEDVITVTQNGIFIGGVQYEVN